MNIETLAKLLVDQQFKLSVAESCTGGGLSSVLTSISGASNYFDRGYITYSNQAKIEMLQVNPDTLKQFGAVSEQTAKEMARGALQSSGSDISVSVTGIAGPSGGTRDKPVGMVCFGFCICERCFEQTQYFDGDRNAVVEASITFVLSTLIDELSA